MIGYLNIDASLLLTGEQKQLVKEKLSNRINADGSLFVKSQVHRTQLSNKLEAAEKINELVQKALLKKKKRLATRLPKAVKEKRLEGKKKKSEVKEGRRKFRPDSF